MQTRLRLFKSTIRQCQRSLPEFMQAAVQKDFPLLIQEAHKIKGTGALMSVMDLSMLGERLEIAARANDLNEVQRQLEALSQYLNSITIAAQK